MRQGIAEDSPTLEAPGFAKVAGGFERGAQEGGGAGGSVVRQSPPGVAGQGEPPPRGRAAGRPGPGDRCQPDPPAEAPEPQEELRQVDRACPAGDRRPPGPVPVAAQDRRRKPDGEPHQREQAGHEPGFRVGALTRRLLGRGRQERGMGGEQRLDFGFHARRLVRLRRHAGLEGSQQRRAALLRRIPEQVRLIKILIADEERC